MSTVRINAHSSGSLTLAENDKIAITSFDGAEYSVYYADAPPSRGAAGKARSDAENLELPHGWTLHAAYTEPVTLGVFVGDKRIKITAGDSPVDYVTGATPAVTVDYGLDLTTGGGALPIAPAIAEIRLSNEVCIISGDGVPVDYTDGTPPATGEGTAEKGSIYIRTNTGKLYINGGTKAQPVWKLVTSAA